MAEAALALEESPGRERFNRAVALLIGGGSTIIRRLFDHIHSPLTLADVLQNQHRATLDNLRTRRILNSDQWTKLFPTSTTCGESKDFDLTLLFVLLRNICNLTPPVNGWDTLPNVSDLQLEDDLARVKFHRNNTIAHAVDATLSEDEFNDCWDEVSHALLRILTFYDTQESITIWEREIAKLRSGPISWKHIQKWLAEFPSKSHFCHLF